MSTPANTPSLALSFLPRSLEEARSLSSVLAACLLLPKALQGKADDVLATIMAGAELGFPPMAAMRSIHVIEGKPVISADGMVAVVLGRGVAKYFDRVAEVEGESVTYETCRVGSERPRRCTWTIAKAKRAALTNKDNWRLYPTAMLAARAKAELARDVYPDVLAGCYIHDELGLRDDTGSVIADASFVEIKDTPLLEGHTIARHGEERPAAPPAFDHEAEYQRASDALADNLDEALQGFLVEIANAPDITALYKIAGTSPAKPQRGTKEHDLAAAAFRKRESQLQGAST